MPTTYAECRNQFIATGDLNYLMAMELYVTANQEPTQSERNEAMANSLGFKILCNSLAGIMVLGILAFLAALVIGG